MDREISLTVNGRRHTLSVPIRALLVDVIRDRLDLTGTHVGCSYEGRCGACTVILDGEAVKSCMVLAVQADGGSVVTCEGLDDLGPDPGQLHPIQDAFWERGGLQCGYCTPGMLMTTFDLIRTELDRDEPDFSEENIRHGLIGNICRCTGYVHIVQAVRDAGERLQGMPEDERRAYFETPSA